MQYQFGSYKVFLGIALLLGNAVSAFAESAVSGPAQEQPSKYDFAVTTVYKDQTHPYYGKGIEAGYAINGSQSSTPVLVRGKTYTFDVDTGVTHDFYFSTKPIGWGMDTMTSGVKGHYTYKGVVTFTPNTETPDVVYAACRNHKYMGGTEIRIVNPGEEGKIKKEKVTSDSGH